MRLKLRHLGSVTDWIHEKTLCNEARERTEKWIVAVALLSFFGHLLLICSAHLGLFGENPPELLADPIAAIYTPFSFILVYEVYLLIFFLPASITQYIAKQYEIITLIVIRRLFKDIADLELTANWFQNQADLQFTYDIITTLILFALLYLFYSLITGRERTATLKIDESLQRFIRIKKHLSAVLMPVFLILALFSFGTWTVDVFFSTLELRDSGKNLNAIFFDDFFTILILTDVMLLIVSFIHTQEFAKVIRNSGFIISTVMLKLSFSAVGLVNIALVIGAVLFGVGILYLYNKHEQLSQRSRVGAE
ncbi:MAG: hypothetical protein ACON4O_04820 [Lentimonas sp.]